MRKLLETTPVSLDGVVDSPQEWALPHWHEEDRAYARAAPADVGATASLAETTWNATIDTGGMTPTLTATKTFGNDIAALTYVPEYVPAHLGTAATGHSA